MTRSVALDAWHYDCGRIDGFQQYSRLERLNHLHHFSLGGPLGSYVVQGLFKPEADLLKILSMCLAHNIAMGPKDADGIASVYIEAIYANREFNGAQILIAKRSSPASPCRAVRDAVKSRDHSKYTHNTEDKW